MPNPDTTDELPIDEMARVIAAAIWRPQPHMSGDIWQRLGAHQRRHAEDAAREAFAVVMQWEAGK